MTPEDIRALEDILDVRDFYLSQKRRDEIELGERAAAILYQPRVLRKDRSAFATPTCCHKLTVIPLSKSLSPPATP